MNHVHLALERRFGGRSWVNSTEVEVMLRSRDDAGKWHCFRRFDFVAANVCAGTGFIVVGAEVKVSRQDFLNELQDEAKFKTMQRMTHVAYYAAPKGMTKKTELPSGAGLLELQTDGRLREVVRPAKNDQADVSQVLAGMLRRSYVASARESLRAVATELRFSGVSVTGFQNPDWWASRVRKRLSSNKGRL